MTYAEKLKDPRWQKKRLEIMERDKFTCQKCFDATKTLNVHHRYYTKGAAPWGYDSSALVTFCERCHKKTEDRISFMNRAIHEKEWRQTRFLRLLSADLGDGPYSDLCFSWMVEHLSEFIGTFERAISDDDQSEETRLNYLSDLRLMIYEIVKGLHTATDLAESIMVKQFKEEQPLEDQNCYPPKELERPIKRRKKERFSNVY